MCNDINYLYLKDHKVFAGLAKEQLYEVLKHAKFSRKRKSDIIRLSENEKPKLYFLIKGKVKIVETDRMSNSLIKAVEKEGSVFGNFVKNDAVNNYEYAQSLSNETVYFYINYQDFNTLCGAIPRLSLNLFESISEKLKKSEVRYSHLAFKDVKTRLVYFFKFWASEEGKQEGNSIVIQNYLTHSDIAEIISTCRQTVTSILNDLKSNGFISYSRKEIVISNIARLDTAA
ncbi:Crp/Fnr family transcriptional regulator [Reichenbachiella sp. MALMAid0571]|uniref:Crp/Fnr family transcriptional regulator n=1 Tax=Reichenbachiella sp. MALMAid0571 TaxID=3143939 RepID=UPI0032DEAA05